MVIKVVLVEDQTLVREGIRSLLRLSDEIVVVGEAADGDDGLRVIAATAPDVVLLDLRMPRRDGLATLRAMAVPRPAVLVLTTFDDDAVLLALQAGAEGYLLKDVTLEHLVASIRAVAAGGTVVQPGTTCPGSWRSSESATGPALPCAGWSWESCSGPPDAAGRSVTSGTCPAGPASLA